MAEYEPFPTGADEVVDDRRLAGRIVGCFGCGGLGVAGFLGAIVLLIAGLGAGTSGCDIDLGPGEGTDSQRLPVSVTPQTGLADGSTVRVTSPAFGADAVVGVAVCLRSADTQRRGVEACDENQGARYATDADGRLDATYPVPRVITVGGKPYDCARSPKRCIVVAADANDYDRSGGRTISFAPDLPSPTLVAVTTRAASDHLPIGSQPPVDGPGARPVAAGTDLTVLASGFQPNEPLMVAYCRPDLEDEGMIVACEPVDQSLALTAIMTRSVDGAFPRADASGAFTTTLSARPEVAPPGADLGGVPSEPSSTTTEAGRPGGTSASSPDSEGERYACTTAEGGCVIVVAAAADTKRSALLPYVVG